MMIMADRKQPFKLIIHISVCVCEMVEWRDQLFRYDYSKAVDGTLYSQFEGLRPLEAKCKLFLRLGVWRLEIKCTLSISDKAF